MSAALRARVAPGIGNATRRVLHAAVMLALGVAAWSWLLGRVDLGALEAQARRLPPWAWMAAGGALLAGHAMRAWRLRREWRHAHPASWPECLRLVLVHNALVLLLPLRAGEAGFVWAVRACWGVSWGAAALALLRWRLQDLAVLAVLAVALLVPASLLLRCLLVALVVALLHGLLPPLWSWLRARAVRRTGALPHGHSVWSGIAIGGANWMLKVLANGGLLAGLAGLPLDTAWRGAFGGELGGVQPLQPPAGLGTYEAGIWLAVHLPAALEPRVVSAALAVHAFSLVVGLGAAGLALLALGPLPLSQGPAR